MRPSRTTIGSLGFAVLVLAVDCAVFRGALDDRPEPGWIFAFFLLPMVDVLMVGLYRLRKPGRRTPRAVGFLAAGSVATAAVFATAVLAPRAIDALIARSLSPVAHALFAGLSYLLGGAAMTTRAMELTIGIVFEILFPAAFFCGPPLIAAALGGRVGRRVGDGHRRSAMAPSAVIPRPHAPMAAAIERG